MKLTKKYAIDILVMFYEIQMFKEQFVPGILNMVQGIENPENITLNITYSLRQDFEKIDHDALPEEGYLIAEFAKQVEILEKTGITVHDFVVTEGHADEIEQVEFEPYSIARTRREFNHKYANKVDILMWGETDSMFPKETFEALEQIASYANSNNIYKYVVTFSYRKMWDTSWKLIEHPEFTDVQFEDTDEWNLRNIASEKCTMTLKQMNELNERYTKDGYDMTYISKPKFDGSCVCFSSDLIKAGVNIPHALLMSGEDTSFARSAEILLGDQYIQFHIKNLLRVHNRRYPNKRMYIKGENNPQGFCGDRKGDWWKILEQWSKENLANLGNAKFKFYTWQEYFTSMIQQGYLK